MNSAFLYVAIMLLFLGLLGVAAAFIGFGKKKEQSLEGMLSAYSVSRAPSQQPAEREGLGASETALGTTTMTRRTVGLADKVVADRGFDEQLKAALAAADINLRAGEWMVIHLLVTVGLGIVMGLLSSFSIIASLLGMGVGFALPYVFLNIKKSQRRKQFYQALPDTLQMVAGSLSAGHSLSQAFDMTARETEGPMAEELQRAIVDTRLGKSLEDGLEEIAERMDSQDFSWVVMSIRIQKEVGGNLSEVLNTVAGTLRERERLRRQVNVLAAEGKLSAYILAGLPIVVAMAISVMNPGYLDPLWTNPLGIVLVFVGGVTFVLGCLWMRAVVKVKV